MSGESKIIELKRLRKKNSTARTVPEEVTAVTSLNKLLQCSR